MSKGNLTDDELANALFLCDHRTSLESISYLTAAKERIRWLSRRLAESTSPQKQSPLSDDEIEQLAIKYGGLNDCFYRGDFSYLEFAKSIEKAHKIGSDNE